MISTSKKQNPPHLPGGNYFDDIRVDIAAAHRWMDEQEVDERSIARPRWKNGLSLFAHRVFRKLKLHYFLISSGIEDGWLREFQKYWTSVLNGRPIWNPSDFFMLLFDYRKRQQFTVDLEWGDASQHLENWQHPSQIYSTLHHVERMASNPHVHPPFWKYLKKNQRVLEYGCSSAPYYHCYRKFFSHLEAHWTLVDLPNFPFHYAKYLYRGESSAKLVTINESDFRDPLQACSEKFDTIILTTVLEHLDDPLFVVRYLFDRLECGGVFLFDFVKSEGTGLDHPDSLAARRECLDFIFSKVDILEGTVGDIDSDIPLIISRKK